MIEKEKKTGVKHPYMSRDVQALATLQKVILKQRAYELTHEDSLKARRWAQRQKGIQEKCGQAKGTNLVKKFTRGHPWTSGSYPMDTD